MTHDGSPQDGTPGLVASAGGPATTGCPIARIRCEEGEPSCKIRIDPRSSCGQWQVSTPPSRRGTISRSGSFSTTEPSSLSRFTVDPTLAGLETLSQRLAALPAPVTAVVEPTSMTWLALALAVERAGGQMDMIGARHSARLRGAIMGKNKSDVIDSEVLTHAGEIFDPPPLVLASPAQLALRRAVVRRAGAVIDGNRYWRRLMSLARWAFPDVWTAFAGSEVNSPCRARPLAPPALPGLGARGDPDGGGRRSTPAMLADTPARAAAIKAAARGWAGLLGRASGPGRAGR